MKLRGIYADASTGKKLLIVLLVFAIMFLVTVMALTVITILTGSGQEDRTIMLTGVVLQNLLLFILSPLICVFFISAPGEDMLKTRRFPSLSEFLLCLLTMIVMTPAMNLLVMWNQSMHLPEALSGLEEWMRQQEDMAEETTRILLDAKSIGALLLLIFIVGFLTGVGEEFTFRGIIQNLIAGKRRNAHAAVWITAIIFSAVHLQFYGFIPRLAIGAYLGYLLVWSRSIWLPVFAHFVNNSLAVISSYIVANGYCSDKIDTIGTSQDGTLWMAAASAVAFAACATQLYHISKEAQTPPPP